MSGRDEEATEAERERSHTSSARPVSRESYGDGAKAEPVGTDGAEGRAQVTHPRTAH